MTDPTNPQQPPAQPNPYQTPPAPPAAQPAQPNAYQAAPGAPAAPLTEAEDKQWASFAHFGGIIGFLPSLIIFLVFKDRGARTRVEAKEALNWQITWIAVAIVLAIVLGILDVILWNAIPLEAWGVYLAISAIFGILRFVPWLANVVFSIMGGVKVNGGGSYRYPFAIRLIK